MDGSAGTEPARTREVPRSSGLALLRWSAWLAVAQSVLMCLQPVMAGWSLDGDGPALTMHRLNGSAALGVTTILLALTILAWRPGRAPGWIPVAVAALFLAENVQHIIGYTDVLAVHLPLGVGLVVGSLALASALLRESRRLAGAAR